MLPCGHPCSTNLPCVSLIARLVSLSRERGWRVMAVNKAVLIGNLGRDPEVRYLPSGQPVASFSIATSESFNDRNGGRQERTDWHNIVVFGKQAELCGQYLKKGRQVYIEGRISNRQYEAKDGGGKRKRSEIV